MFEWFFRGRKVDKICLELFRADGMRLMETYESFNPITLPGHSLRLGIFYDSILFRDEPIIYCNIDTDGYIIPSWHLKTGLLRVLPSSFPTELHDLKNRLLDITGDVGLDNSSYKMSDTTHNEINKAIGEMIVLHKLSE